MRTAGTGEQAQVDFGKSQLGFLGHQADIERQQQLRAAAKRPAVDGANGGLVGYLEAAKDPVDHLRELLVVLKALAARQVRNVATGHEGLVAGTGDHDHAHAGIALEVCQCGLQRQQRRRVQGIERLGPVDGQQAHGALALAQDGVAFVGHLKFPRIF
ncbi:hypothetical protein D3C71_1602430 [compost metagenome]